MKSTGHAGGLGLFFFHGGRRVGAVCGGQQWLLDHDAVVSPVNYLTLAHQRTTHALSDTIISLSV